MTTVAEGTGAQGQTAGDLSPGQTAGGSPKAPADTGVKKPLAPLINDADGDEATKAAAAAKAKADEAAALEAARQQEETPTEETKKNWQNQYVNVDHAQGQAAINLMKEAGVSPVEANAIFAKSIASGDLKDVDWDTLEAKVGKDKAILVKAGVEAYFNEKVAVVRETTKDAYEIMGSEANWNTVKNWAQKAEKSDPVLHKKVQEIRRAIDVGGWQAKNAVTELRSMYEKAPGNSGLGTTKVLQGDQPGVVAGGALTKADYLAQMHIAYAAGAKAPVINALRARRKQGMAQGI